MAKKCDVCGKPLKGMVEDFKGTHLKCRNTKGTKCRVCGKGISATSATERSRGVHNKCRAKEARELGDKKGR